MPEWLSTLLTIFATVLTCSGFWNWVAMKNQKKSAMAQMVLGLGHDRIIFLCKHYISQGYISPEDYENLNDYLFVPYEAMGGNGSAKRMMEAVRQLPIHN